MIYEGQCTESCAAMVNDRYHRYGYLATLDFSLCYDHIEPEVITEALIKLGFTEDLAELLASVWANIMRYVIFEGECSEKPFPAGEMIMQGDSFGPFALHVLMAAGVNWVKKKMVESRGPPGDREAMRQMLVYMDDRNLTAGDPEVLCEMVKCWHRK